MSTTFYIYYLIRSSKQLYEITYFSGKEEDLNQGLFWFQNHWNFIQIHTLKTFYGPYLVPEFWRYNISLVI